MRFTSRLQLLPIYRGDNCDTSQNFIFFRKNIYYEYINFILDTFVLDGGGNFFLTLCYETLKLKIMKRFIIVAAAIILSCGALSAQNKGDIYFGGMTCLAIQAGDGGVGAGFSIQPEFGGFVADRCRLGISIGYAISGGIHSFTACPNFAYYIRLCDNVYYTPGIEAGFVMAVSGGAYPGLGVGLHLFSMEFRPTKHFGFTANLASVNFVALASAGSSINFDLGLNPTVGIKYYF
jgi:hypothetical protein